MLNLVVRRETARLLKVKKALTLPFSTNRLPILLKRATSGLVSGSHEPSLAN
jgi:hypothetical protein